MADKSKKKVGRPTKLTPQLREEIVELLKSGNYIETVCGLVGINKTTFYLWINKADASTRSTKYSKFRDDVYKAMAFSEARLVTLIAKSAEKDWRAAVWMLERRQPERWGKPEVKNETPQKLESEVKIDKEDKIIIKELLDLIAGGHGRRESSPPKTE